MDWPWTRRGPAKDDLRELRGDVADLRAEVKRLRAEWEDMFERLVRRDDRIRKREERANGASPQLTIPQDKKAALWARLRAGKASQS